MTLTHKCSALFLANLDETAPPESQPRSPKWRPARAEVERATGCGRAAFPPPSRSARARSRLSRAARKWFWAEAKGRRAPLAFLAFDGELELELNWRQTGAKLAGAAELPLRKMQREGRVSPARKLASLQGGKLESSQAGKLTS